MRQRNFEGFCVFLVLFVSVGLTELYEPALGISGLARAQDSPFQSKKIVPFVPSPQEVVDKMVELGGVKPSDVVYDLGSGDGRIVIAAAKRGAKAVGFEIDGDLVKQSRENIRAAGVQDSAEIRQQEKWAIGSLIRPNASRAARFISGSFRQRHARSPTRLPPIPL